MIKDNGLSMMEQVLADFIIKSANEVDTQPLNYTQVKMLSM